MIVLLIFVLLIAVGACAATGYALTDGTRRGAWIGTAAGLVLASGIFWLWQWESRQQADWEAWCASAGGAVNAHSETSTGTGVNPSNGQPVVTTSTSTTYFCLTPDGRILGIR